MYLIQGIRFGSWKVRRLNWALLAINDFNRSQLYTTAHANYDDEADCNKWREFRRSGYELNTLSQFSQ